MDLEKLYQHYLLSRTVSTDSRKITPGCIFFALTGEHFNGNRFALQALQDGAAAAVVDEDPGSDHPGLFRTGNVLQTLQELAALHRRRSGITILAITGSNGKTTTKELVSAVLAKKFRVYATRGNLNNHIGVPLTLLAMGPEVETGIVEMGANHPGEIRDLCAIAQPDAGLITNVGKAHLEGFGSLEGVARAKGELFAYLMASGKPLFLNEGNALLASLVPEDYSRAERYNGTGSMKAVRKSGNPFLTLTLVVSGREETVETRLLGQYNAENVLAACCVGLHFGIPFPDIRDAIAGYVPQNNRSQLIETARNRLYMDAYNANPSSMRAALEEFLRLEHPRKMLVLGEMRELGASSRQEHTALVQYIREHFEGTVYCIGKAFADLPEREHFSWFETADALAASLTESLPSDYFILIKGSRSNQLEKITAVL